MAKYGGTIIKVNSSLASSNKQMQAQLKNKFATHGGAKYYQTVENASKQIVKAAEYYSFGSLKSS